MMKKLNFLLSSAFALVPLNTNFLIKTAVFGTSASIISQNKVVLARDPDNETGIRFGKSGDHENALIYFNKAIENNANPHPDFYSNRGFTKYKLADYEGALIDFDKAIEMQPLKRYYYLRSQVKLTTKDIEGFCNDALLVFEGYYDQTEASIDLLLDNCQPYMEQ